MEGIARSIGASQVRGGGPRALRLAWSEAGGADRDLLPGRCARPAFRLGAVAPGQRSRQGLRRLVGGMGQRRERSRRTLTLRRKCRQ